MLSFIGKVLTDSLCCFVFRGLALPTEGTGQGSQILNTGILHASVKCFPSTVPTGIWDPKCERYFVDVEKSVTKPNSQRFRPKARIILISECLCRFFLPGDARPSPPLRRDARGERRRPAAFAACLLFSPRASRIQPETLRFWNFIASAENQAPASPRVHPPLPPLLTTYHNTV